MKPLNIYYAPVSKKLQSCHHICPSLVPLSAHFIGYFFIHNLCFLSQALCKLVILHKATLQAAGKGSTNSGKSLVE